MSVHKHVDFKDQYFILKFTTINISQSEQMWNFVQQHVENTQIGIQRIQIEQCILVSFHEFDGKRRIPIEVILHKMRQTIQHRFPLTRSTRVSLNYSMSFGMDF
jgi:hypothetical protein